MSTPMQLEFNFASLVPKTAKQEAEARSSGKWAWVEAEVWTERMLAALDNGVKGGKWYSLIDVEKAEKAAGFWQNWSRSQAMAECLFR